MTPEPGTEAGRTMQDHLRIGCDGKDHWLEILAIEAEARAAVLAEVREGVEGLRRYAIGQGENDLTVERTAVLALLDTLSDGGPTDG